VRSGDPNYVTNSGRSWHWTGTGFMGQEANVALFAHRTEHGGAYRYLHALVVGDTWTVTTSDNRVYTYRAVGRTMVRGYSKAGPPVADILAAVRAFPGTTLSLVACTRTDWLPTSLNHRIVVTGELIEWREL
jgi:sortase (surface protein transpeptidase)